MRGASRAMREPPCATVGTPDILPDSVAVAIQPPRRSSVHARSRYTSGLAIPRTSQPIYDAQVAAILGLPVKKGKDLAVNVNTCIAVYESLRESVRQLLLDEGIKNRIAALKAAYNSNISDEKALDFL